MRISTLAQQGTDGFIKGVVATDVFAREIKSSIAIKPSGRMHSAGRIVQRLMLAQGSESTLNRLIRYFAIFDLENTKLFVWMTVNNY